MENRIFKLIHFSPIGFKVPNYPLSYCPLCRGSLLEVCGLCLEEKCANCEIVSENDIHYHQHCYQLMKEKKNL